MNKNIAITTLFLLSAFLTLAQKKAQPKDSTVSLVLAVRFTGKEVRLRWAPSRSGAWTLLNRTGYKLERFEITTSGERVNPIMMSVVPIKPEPLDKWKRFATPGNENDYALIAAQSIYGKKFTTSKSSMLNQADELTNRYSFTVFSADMNFETARASGLGFLDSTAEIGKNYHYKLSSAERLKDYMEIDTAEVSVDTRNVHEILRPRLGVVLEKEREVTLSWTKILHSQQFSAYYIERSADGKAYTRLNKKPYINMASDLEDKPEFTYADSVANYIPYQYRLIGITAFGEESPASEPVRAMGRDRTPPVQPVNVQAKSLADGKVNIIWESTDPGDLAGFYVGRSTDPLVGFKPLFEKPLPVSARSYVDENPATDVANYYLVIAADTANNAAASLSVFSPVVDSIPPAPPTGLVAKIDTNGILRLRWKKNSEKDVKGYIVSYANQRDHDFTTAVNKAIFSNEFSDTLRLWTLTEKIFYTVRAVDKNNNTSRFSDTLEVVKPDIVPPSSPVFKKYKLENKGLTLEWIPSSSSDVVRHILKRRELTSGGFKEIAIFGIKSQKNFADTTVKSGKKYEYQLMAVDDAGLYSTKPTLLQVRIPDFQGQAGAAGFKATYNTTTKQVELVWNNPSGSKGVTIYRAQEGGVFENIGSVQGSTGRYVDKNAKPGVVYQYTSRVNYANGESSAFAETVKLSF